MAIAPMHSRLRSSQLVGYNAQPAIASLVPRPINHNVHQQLPKPRTPPRGGAQLLLKALPAAQTNKQDGDRCDQRDALQHVDEAINTAVLVRIVCGWCVG